MVMWVETTLFVTQWNFTRSSSETNLLRDMEALGVAGRHLKYQCISPLVFSLHRWNCHNRLSWITVMFFTALSVSQISVLYSSYKG
jgi:hypothetical protein